MGWDAKPGPPPLSASVDKIMARLRVRQAGCVTGNGNGNARDGRALVQTSERLLCCVAYATKYARSQSAYHCVRTFAYAMLLRV